MKPAEQKTTISGIAEAAGVSKTTVSRYLNGKYEYMSEKTRKRIEAVIDVTGYRPSNIARSLKSKKSMLIGVVIADIASPFSASVISGVGETLRHAGYSTIIVNADNSLALEHEYIRSLMAQCVDGLLINTTDTENPFLIELASQGVPIVLLDRVVKDYNFDISCIECHESMLHAMSHLMGQGYGRLAFFTQPPEKISPRYLRQQAFVGQLREVGVANPESFVYTVDIYDPESTVNQMKRLVATSRGQTPAIIAANGVTLLHTLNASRELQFNIPRDIGICGYDDWGWTEQMGWAPLIHPGITTITANSKDVGSQAALLLLDRMADPNCPKRAVAVPTQMIVRRSTCLEERPG